jgi:hypothetical protein
MLVPLTLGAIGLLALAQHEWTTPSTTETPAPAPPRPRLPPPESIEEAVVDIEPSPPREVMDAFIDEIASQGKTPAPLASLARRTLTTHEPTWSTIVIPCDQRVHQLLPSPELLERVAKTISDAYHVETVIYPARWSHPVLGSVGLCAISFYEPGTAPPSKSQVLDPVAAQLSTFLGRGEYVEYGAGILDPGRLLQLVVDSFIGAAVGTVSSMGVQALIRSAGGEPRLARLVRRYKRAEQREGPRARRLLAKIKRTAERIKGRHVDWNEVESLVAKYDREKAVST